MTIVRKSHMAERTGAIVDASRGAHDTPGSPRRQDQNSVGLGEACPQWRAEWRRNRRTYFAKDRPSFSGEFKNCAYCGVAFESLGETPHIDHVVPRSRGGSNSRGNLMLVCQECNLMKGSKSLESIRPKIMQKRLGWPQFTADQLSWLRSAGFDMSPYDNAKFWFEESQI